MGTCIQSINNKLLEIQNEWLLEVVNPFVVSRRNEQFSRPFHLGISSGIDPNKKLIMVIGQEAKDFGKYEDVDTPKDIQKECTSYFDEQIQENTSRNNSPFWRFFCALKKKEFELCWNNIDKLHRYKTVEKKEVTYPLTIGQERILSAQYGADSKSLLQRELEVVRPDAIAFVTGPHYRVSMCTAFGLPENALDQCMPNKTNYLINIGQELGLDIPVFWTYHPAYLNRNHGFTEKVISGIEQELRAFA